MPTLDETTLDLLEKVRKGATAKFVLINKGVKILNLVVFRKGDVDGQVRKAKATATGDAYVGIVVGSGAELRFLLSAAEYSAPPGRELILKDFLKTSADLRLSSAVYELVPEPTDELLRRGDEISPTPGSKLETPVSSGSGDSDVTTVTTSGSGDSTPDVALKMAAVRDKMAQWFAAFQLGQLSPEDLLLVKREFGGSLQIISQFLQGNDDLPLAEVLAAQKTLDSTLRKESLAALGVRERWERLSLDVDASIEELVLAVGRLVPAERPEVLRTALREAMRTRRASLESALSPLFQPERVTSESIVEAAELVEQRLGALRDDRLFRYLAAAPGALQTERDPGSVFQAGVSAIHSRLVSR